MLELLRLLVGTVVLRPYVFVFFAVYLFLAISTIGWRRTLLYTVLTYLIAFLCEYSSIQNGFPFGLYYYIPATTDKELWIAGVPFMDSLSFTFLSYISFELAIYLRSPLIVRSLDVQVVRLKRIRASWFTSAIAGLLMMYLDIVIDPVALQGDRWFLGKIYYYPNGGSYFGITIANFIGWWIICMLIIRIYLVIEGWLAGQLRETTAWNYPLQGLAPAGLYFGVLGFNVTMTFLINELTMGYASTFISLLLFILFANHLATCRMFQPHTQLAEHRRDFPASPLINKFPELFAATEASTTAAKLSQADGRRETVTT